MPVLYDDPTETNETTGPLSELEAYSAGLTAFFPEELPTLDHWVAFRIAKDIKFRRDEVRKEDTEVTVFLPMPSNIATAYNAEYSNPALGPAGGLGGAAGEFARSIGSGSAEDISTSIANKIKSLDPEALSASVKSGLANILSTAIESNIGSLAALAVGGPLAGVAAAGATGVYQGALAGAGIATNPGLATLFTGTSFRTHSFSYKFVPRSTFESEKLKEIILHFKYAMAPDYLAENHFFDYPNQFDIEFHYPKFLFDIGASVLTSFTVDYSTENGSYFLDNEGAPVSVTISMTFQELTIITKDKIREFR